VVVELSAWFGGLRCGDERVQPWQARGGACSLERAAREEERREKWGKPTGAQDFASKDMQERRHGVLRAREQPRGGRTLASVGHDFKLRVWIEADRVDWQADFDAPDLPN
jgi:hypothetical protein